MGVVDRSAPPRAAVHVALATVGLGLNLRAWILLGPHLHQRFGVGLTGHLLLMGLPLLVATLVRLPVGVLTDRYGARLTFPAVSLAAAGCVTGLALAGSLPLAVVAGAGAGVAGGAFVVGGALLSRTLPYGRRGLGLGVFSLGPALTVAVSAVSRDADPDGRRSTLVLAAALVAFAVLAALVLRDRGDPRGMPVRRYLEMVRLASRTSLPLLYLLALGGLVAVAVYLPVYLTAVYHLSWSSALTVTGLVVTLGAVARLVGGWWTDRHPATTPLLVCYTVAAGLCVVAAVSPRSCWLAVPLIAGMSACDGAAGGALLALIGKATRPDSAGAVMGVTGAAAALGTLLPPVLLAGVDRLAGSESAAWLLLATVLTGVAVYARTHGLRVELGLPVRFEPGRTTTAMTVAMVADPDTRYGTPALVSRLAELAACDELVVVYGSDLPPPERATERVLVAGLRMRLPRHRVVPLDLPPRTWSRGRFGDLLSELVEVGSLPVAITAAADLPRVAAELSLHLRADRIMTTSYSRAQGANVREVWNRA